jgi:Uma2 family endonuclease
MVNVVAEADQVTLPNWVVDLESFRRWCDAEDVPEKARIWYLKGEVWIDMSKEQIFSHVLVKTEIAAQLTRLVKAEKLGLYLGDGVRLSNVSADFSVRPDGTFIAYATLQSGQVRLVEGMEGGYLELEGAPDLVLEVISRSSVRKDTVFLRRAYAAAGIREYWLVDARKEPLSFTILRLGTRGYVAARKQHGWNKSAVFGKAFRLLQQTSPLGHPDYRLEIG